MASTYVQIRGANAPLSYALKYLGPGSFNSLRRLRVTIKNTGKQDPTLPYQYGYQVLVKIPGVKDYVGTVEAPVSLSSFF